MAELRIHTVLRSRYAVFDASGRLPFSIVFGLCRHSSADVDPRSLKLDTTKSILDVPYALANGWLTIHEHASDSSSIQQRQLDMSNVRPDEAKERSFVSLASPVDRAGNWRDDFTPFYYDILPDSALARHFQVGKSYSISLASQDLHVKWWAYGDTHRVEDQPTQSAKLINQKSVPEGKANFKVVDSLPQAPKIETRLQSLFTDAEGRSILRISVQNTSDQAIIIQTRGHQQFLAPWGPFQPEEWASDDRPRIIDTTSDRPPISALEVVDPATNAVVKQITRPASAPLTSAHDARPKRDALVTLKPDEPLISSLDISTLLMGMPDGRYALRLARRGVWWCCGTPNDLIDGGRISADVYNIAVPPIILESEVDLEMTIAGGRVP